MQPQCNRRADQLRPLRRPSPAASIPAVPVPASPLAASCARAAEVSSGGFGSAQVDAIKAALQNQKFLWSMVEARHALGNRKRRAASFFPVRKQRARGNVAGARPDGTFAHSIEPSAWASRYASVLNWIQVERRSTNRNSELRARFEEDPIVRAMLQKFGGQISSVKRPGEE